jgi:hypothetical protein
MNDRPRSGAAFPDQLLEAAYSIIPRTASHPGAGVKNGRQVLILEALLDAAAVVARGIADNAHDDCLPIPADVAHDMAKTTDAITNAITDATRPEPSGTWGSPVNTQGFSLPSMCGGELI